MPLQDKYFVFTVKLPIDLIDTILPNFQIDRRDVISNTLHLQGLELFWVVSELVERPSGALPDW